MKNGAPISDVSIPSGISIENKLLDSYLHTIRRYVLPINIDVGINFL